MPWKVLTAEARGRSVYMTGKDRRSEADIVIGRRLSRFYSRGHRHNLMNCRALNTKSRWAYASKLRHRSENIPIMHVSVLKWEQHMGLILGQECTIF